MIDVLYQQDALTLRIAQHAHDASRETRLEQADGSLHGHPQGGVTAQESSHTLQATFGSALVSRRNHTPSLAR